MKVFLAAAACFLFTPLALLGQSPSASPKPTPAATPAASYVRPEQKKRFKDFVNGAIGPVTLAKNAVTSGIGTWANSPREWGDKWEGFGRRFASASGKSVLDSSIKYGLEEAFRLDSRFYKSKDRSARARLINALISPVTARNKSGKRVFGFPALAGSYGSSIIAYETWYPPRYNFKNGLRSGTLSIGFDAAFNLFKEFVWKK